MSTVYAAKSWKVPIKLYREEGLSMPLASMKGVCRMGYKLNHYSHHIFLSVLHLIFLEKIEQLEKLES